MATWRRRRVLLRLSQVQLRGLAFVKTQFRQTNGQKQLFVINGGKAVRRQIETGMEQARMVQVLQGVELGEQVVIVGNEKLKPGMPVALGGAGRKSSSTGKASSAGKKSARTGGPRR